MKAGRVERMEDNELPKRVSEERKNERRQIGKRNKL